MAHYFDKDPESKEIPGFFSLRWQDKPFLFHYATGMFSPGHLDKGAKMLLEYARIENGQRVCDLGCAYGVVGIVLARMYDISLVLVDVNERALKYAKKNAEENVTNCKIIASDGFANVPEKFHVVLLNPPQHAGKEVCMRLIKESHEHLVSGGSLQLVARHNVGGKSFEKYMKELFGNVEALGKEAGFRVYSSKKTNIQE